jgi:hypothetical protein
MTRELWLEAHSYLRPIADLSAQVDRDCSKPPAERCNLLRPHAAVQWESMEKDDGETRSLIVVGDVDTVYLSLH